MPVIDLNKLVISLLSNCDDNIPQDIILKANLEKALREQGIIHKDGELFEEDSPEFVGLSELNKEWDADIIKRKAWEFIEYAFYEVELRYKDDTCWHEIHCMFNRFESLKRSFDEYVK